MARHIKRSKVIRSYDGLDREEKTGGLMFLRVATVLLIGAFIAVCVSFFMYSYLKGEQAVSVGSGESTNGYYTYFTAEDEVKLIEYCDSTHPLSEYYSTQMTEFSDSIKVCRLMSESLEKMIAAAEKDGIYISIRNGYKSAEECDLEYNRLCGAFQREGCTVAEAESKARAICPPSEYNEFGTGMLIEINNVSGKDFSDTDIYKWLYKNGINYGFINRYTPDKETVTGMNADLTVYRFVGVDNAVKMRSYGMCLEEYYEYCSYRQ
ncbi:MAG: D-alanyl-D-alanine carboxypeptidase family protein [Clostridia bacterium]|nr:D-alanyl-D-alanine carboxypeptidase family protein [Clostridia bacterium]